MSEDIRVPPIVEAIIRAAAGGSEADRDERASTFARGLALGALVGAAIAGSTIWQRRHARSHAVVDVTTEPAGPSDPDESARAQG